MKTTLFEVTAAAHFPVVQIPCPVFGFNILKNKPEVVIEMSENCKILVKCGWLIV
jgi:hypothetical protein